MAVRKQRATTSATYAIELNYDKCLIKAKKIHRHEGQFWIVKVIGSYSSVSELDKNLYYKDEKNIEHWKFEGVRWVKLSGNLEDV